MTMMTLFQKNESGANTKMLPDDIRMDWIIGPIYVICSNGGFFIIFLFVNENLSTFYVISYDFFHNVELF